MVGISVPTRLICPGDPSPGPPQATFSYHHGLIVAQVPCSRRKHPRSPPFVRLLSRTGFQGKSGQNSRTGDRRMADRRRAGQQRGSGKRHVDPTRVHSARKERTPIGGWIQVGRGRLHIAMVIIVKQGIAAAGVMPRTSGIRRRGKCQRDRGQWGQGHSCFFHSNLPRSVMAPWSNKQ
jgi:hypothetical protein